MSDLQPSPFVKIRVIRGSIERRGFEGWDMRILSPRICTNIGTIWLRLMKVAAQVHGSGRRVHVRLTSAYQLQPVFPSCQSRLLRLVTATD